MSGPHTSEGAASPAVVIEEAHDLPVVQMQWTLRTGSASDPPGREGLARMTAAMLLRGAGGRTRAETDETLDRLGAGLDAEADADSVSLTGWVLRRNLAPFLDLFSGVLCAPEFPEEEVEKLRREMKAALDEMRDDDRDLCARHFARHLYGSHPYARPASGTDASLESVRRDEIVDFYRRHFRRAGAIAGVAGDLDEDAARRGVEQAAARLVGPSDAHPPALPDPPLPAGRTLLVVDKPERTQSQILLGHPAPRWGTPEYDALQLAATAFGGTFTARLMTEVRVRRGLSYGAYASVHGGRGRRHLDLWVFPAAEDTVETLDLVLRLYEELAAQGPTDDELAFARRHLVGRFPLAVETPEQRLAYRTDLALCGLPEELLWGYRERIESVMPAAVRDAVAAHATPWRLAITLVATADRLLPDLEAARDRLRLDEIRVEPYDRF